MTTKNSEREGRKRLHGRNRCGEYGSFYQTGGSSARSKVDEKKPMLTRQESKHRFKAHQC